MSIVEFYIGQIFCVTGDGQVMIREGMCVKYGRIGRRKDRTRVVVRRKRTSKLYTKR